FSSRRRHTRFSRDWSSDVCSSDLTALSILTTTFHEGPARNRALSVFSVFGASGYSSGLILGGLLTGFGWRWTFLTPVPLAVLARSEERRGGQGGGARGSPGRCCER